MFHSGFKRLGGLFSTAFGLGIFLLILGAPFSSFAFEGQNRLLSVDVEQESGNPVVRLQTEQPVGDRYTVYDSTDPVRVVVDFPEMDVSAVQSLVDADLPPLDKVRISSYELTSGKLGRVELLLSAVGKYDVAVKDNVFQVKFGEKKAEDGEGISEAVQPAGSEIEPARTENTEKTLVKKVPVDEPAEEIQPETPSRAIPERGKVVSPAATVESVETGDSQTLLRADGRIGKFRYFSLAGPPRLVVDIYDVKPGFRQRSFDLGQEFRQIRVGTYKDKVRFVFDAESGGLPDYSVSRADDGIGVYWGSGAHPVSKTAPEVLEVPVMIKNLDFSVEDGLSVFTVSLSGKAEIIEPEGEDDIIRFGVKDATIDRDLRRSIDTSAFPSAVRLITPYPVLVKDGQDVRFAVELKGPVPYRLESNGRTLRFIVENGPFAEPLSAEAEKMEVAVPPQTAVAETAPVSAEQEKAGEEKPEPAYEPFTGTGSPIEVISGKGKGKYTGEKITLVFDNADVRRIFQLIAEVSDLNIIVGDEVGGTITLRLIDVPWDQALDLILDIKDLGMIQEGNVVRVLPSDKIREMRQAELKAVQEERELEPVTTEVITVSYTGLENVTGPAGELLTERGKITPDDRNKQLIVTDIPAVVEEIKKLVDILDTPEKQVMIEARIVEARTNLTRDLGITWAFSYAADDVNSVDDLNTVDIGGGGSFIINPSVGAGGLGTGITFGQLGVSSSVLDLRLSAAETAGQSKVISKPRVTTLNGEAATISQGTTIPYQSVSDQGTKTEFVDATLSLEVTPVINPDNSVILTINAANNTPTTVSGATAPGINKKEASTKVLVRNGETTVLGGIFTESNSTSDQGIPFLMRLPIIGHLFKSSNKQNDRSELLVFITPRILD